MGLIERFKVRQATINEEKLRKESRKTGILAELDREAKKRQQLATEQLINNSFSFIEDYVEKETKYGTWEGFFKDKQTIKVPLSALHRFMIPETRYCSDGEYIEYSESCYDRDWKNRLVRLLEERHHNWKVIFAESYAGPGGYGEPERFLIAVKRVL